MTFPTNATIRHELDRLSDYATGYTLLDDATDADSWPSSGSPLTVTAESMPVYGTASIKLAHTSGSYRYATKNFASGLTLKHWLVFDAYIDDASEASGFRIEATSSDGTLLYWKTLTATQTGINPDVTHPRSGINRFFFPVSTFDAAGGADWADVRNLRFRLRTNGGTVNVWVGKVETVDLRPKVTFIFDDQHQTVYDFAYPEMDSRGFKGSVAVCTGMPNYQNVTEHSHESGSYLAGEMSQANLAALQSAGWDLLSHSVTHPNFDTMYTEGLEDEIAWEAETAKAYLESTFGPDSIARNVFVGPYGSGDSAGAKDILALSYDAQFTNAQYNTPLRHEQLDPQTYANTWARMSRQAGDNKTTAQLTAHVDAAIAGQYWLVYMFHTFHATTGGALACVEAEFEGLLDYLTAQSASVDVVTVKEYVVEQLGSDPTAASTGTPSGIPGNLGINVAVRIGL